MKTEKRTVRTTCPRDCYDACGIVAIVRNDRVTRVLGDPQHAVAKGALCAKCALAYNGAWIDPAQRLLTPLERTGPKGSGQYRRVSWEHALRTIANRLRTVCADFGADTILHTHYTGTCSLIAGAFPCRFFNALGATEVDPDTVCNKAGHQALQTMFGSSFAGFDPRTAPAARCVVIWGANPSTCAPHTDKYWLAEARKHAKIVVVDPIRHDTAAAADLHLQLRPGSDAAVAFAVLHVLVRDGLTDKEFISRSLTGWEDMLGGVQAMTPERAGALSGVDPAVIETFAQWYGRGPSMLWLGQGLQRQRHGGNVIRCIATLPAVTGNIGKPGTGFLYMNSAPARGLDADWLSGIRLRPSGPATISHMDLAAALESRQRSRALFTWNNNIAASSPEQRRLRAALAREDLFHVAVDCFETDSTALADYVLPAASFLEFDDLVVSYFDYTVSAQRQAMPPLGESMPNQEIFRRLAAAMGMSDPALFQSDESLIAAMLDQLSVPIDFQALAERGTIPWSEQPCVPFQDGVFPTPSGRIEVSSAAWSEHGLARAPEAKVDPPPTGGRLRLLSPADPWLMNSSYANDARIADRMGGQKAYIHPEEAERRSLKTGQRVVLENATGRLSLELVTTDRVGQGTLLVPKGRWPSREPEHANVNALNPGDKCDLAESTSVHSIEVELKIE